MFKFLYQTAPYFYKI